MIMSMIRDLRSVIGAVILVVVIRNGFYQGVTMTRCDV
jgi:hypothetical protein